MRQTIDQFLGGWTSAERRGDISRLDTLLSDDFVGVGPLGFVLPKQAWLGRFGGGLAYDRFELEEVQPHDYGEAAVVTTRQTGSGTFGDARLPFESVRATLTLIRHDDCWRLAAAHMSFIAGTPGAPPLPAAARAASDDEDRNQPVGDPGSDNG
jgi:ketosteroid isomerase-like protein